MDDPPAPADITKCHEESFQFKTDDDLVTVAVSVEYQPRKQTLSASAFTDLLDYTGDLPPEWMVVDLYERIVEAIYPGYAGREDPWENVPMVVTFEVEYRDRETADRRTESITLGSYY